MSDLKSAAKLALDALELVNLEFVCGNGSHHKKEDRHEWDEDCPITDRWRKAIAALKEALAQPEQEQQIETLKRCLFQMQEAAKDLVEQAKSLTPPQRTEPVIDRAAAIRIATALGWEPKREWVVLTAEEVLQCWEKAHEPGNEGLINAIRMADEVEAKLKEKNT